MDNTLKAVIGVIALVGVIIMIIPEGNPLAKKSDAIGRPEVIGAPPPPPPANGRPEVKDAPPVPNATKSDTPGQLIYDTDEYKNFGKPMVDPRPPSEREQPNMGSEQTGPQQPQQYVPMPQGYLPPTTTPDTSNLPVT
jgi:hypothetical protein